jgi:ribosome-binding protein aMBF1 (putative translation factor)
MSYLDSYMDLSMLTGVQVRSARHAIKWSVQDLATNSKVSVSTIKRIEVADGLPSTSVHNLMSIKTALESAGIEFIGTPQDGPGIRIHGK